MWYLLSEAFYSKVVLKVWGKGNQQNQRSKGSFILKEKLTAASQ
jgi:hypothetical protein